MSVTTDGVPQAGDIPLDGLAERLTEDDLGLAILTDEQLAALGQPLHPDGPTGWYGSLEADAQVVAAQAGLRSLLAAGLLRPGEDEDELEVHPSLELLRSCRRHAVGVTQAQRTGVSGTDRALLHLVAPGIVLEELIDPDGLHACTLRSPARIAQMLAVRCDPEGVAGEESGTPVGGPDDDPQAAARTLAEVRDAARWTTQLRTVRRAHDGRDAAATEARLTVVTLPAAVWGLTDPAEGALSHTEVGVALSAQDLMATLLAVLDPAIDDD